MREADRRFMIPLLIGAPGRTNEERVYALGLFMTDEGQAHWLCACARPEVIAVYDAAMFPVGEEP